MTDKTKIHEEPQPEPTAEVAPLTETTPTCDAPMGSAGDLEEARCWCVLPAGHEGDHKCAHMVVQP